MKLSRMWRRLLSHLGNSRVERELNREIAAHIALLEDDYLQQGMSSEEAHRQACRACGGTEQTRQLHRDERGFAWLSHLLQDLRYTLRSFRKYPGFAFTTVATLALGIGASTAIFTVVWATLLAGLPYPHSEQLVIVWGRGHNDVSLGDYLDWSSASHSFQEMTAWTGGRVNVSPTLSGEPPQSMQSRRVTPGYFHLQGVPFALGREFLPAESQPGNGHVVILVNKVWKQLGADPHILGKSLRIDGQPYSVVGVLAPGLEDRGMGQLVIPLTMDPPQDNHDARWLMVMGRLRPGISLAQAQSELNAITAHAGQQDPDAGNSFGALVEPLKNDFIPRNRIIMLWLLLAAVGFLLLIACVNAANLLLSRATVRQQEMAVRGALGAGPRRLFAQCLTESLLLAAFGGAFGIAVAYGGLRALVAILPPDTLPSEADLTLSLPVLAFALAVTTCVGVLFGCVPALFASRVDPADALRSGARSSSDVTHRRLRHSLVITEFTLALTLLSCAALTIHSLWKLMQIDTGVRTDGLLTFRLITPPDPLHDPQQRLVRFLAYDRRIVDTIRTVPGVTEVAASAGTPLEGAGGDMPWSLAGRPAYARPSLRPVSAFDAVTPGYFHALAVRIVAGRSFSDQDNDTSAKVAMVNESFVRRYLGGVDPLSQQILLDPPGSGTPDPGANTTTASIPWQVVGVFHDTRLGQYREDRPEVLLPLWQNPLPNLAFVIRANAEPESLLRNIADTIRTVDPDTAVATPRTMEQVRDDTLADDRFTVVLFSSFGGAALLLAAVGIFGVMAFSVAQRRREIAVRMALGATRVRVVALILQEAALLAAIGSAIGLVGAAIAGHTMHSLLFGISGFDIAAIAASAAALLLTALLACLVPARRAALSEPMESLRVE